MSWRRMRSGIVSGGFEVEAVRFDGVNDFLTTGAGLTGAADAKTVTMSVWVRKQGSDSNSERLLCGNSTVGSGSADQAFRTVKLGDPLNFVPLVAEDSSGNVDVQLDSSAGVMEVADGWVHIMWSFDLSDTAKRHLYVNDVSDLDPTIYNDDTLDLTLADWSVGGFPDGSQLLDGDMAELYMTNEYIDLSVEANRRKFISSGGKPAELGADGSTPTGTAPLVYLSVRPGDAASDFATNRGTGGNFTENGALALSATSPSD